MGQPTEGGERFEGVCAATLTAETAARVNAGVNHAVTRRLTSVMCDRAPEKGLSG